MSLTNEQITATIQELNANLVKSGLTKEQIAQDLKTNIEKINRILSLSQHSLEDPWILKEYLDEKSKNKAMSPSHFQLYQETITNIGF
ncbi:Uncharacterized protein conserved in bacteria [Listeria fleischmannii subsp. fleischmannii]|uniref:Uncharacterized protein conserved in bacteria n=1 Tax=Listeria fleischmannii subsp. fleischmannii TaxID=1671902 RepID=A0A2X3J6Z3_9LIST|nr:Uncharacterized protein conserved in bacteria [Listeria fleischmannii subsp. fleischmannii]